MLIEVWDKRDRLILLFSWIFLISFSFVQNADVFCAFLNICCIILIGNIIYTSPTWKNPLLYWRSLLLYFAHLLIFVFILAGIDFKQATILRWNLLLASLISSILLFLFPVPSAEKLNGPFKKIGTISFTVPLTHNHIEKEIDTYNKELTVQCWFPLDSRKVSDSVHSNAVLWTSGNPSSQVEEASLLLDEIATWQIKVPPFLSRHLLLSRVNAIWQKSMENVAEPVQSPSSGDPSYPVAVYVHGMHGWRQVHSSCCEKLASQGFIVFACDHSPDAMISRPISRATGALKPAVPFDFHLPKDYTLEEERAFYGKGLYRRIHDIHSLIEFISDKEKIGSMFPQLKGHIDLKNINCWGHSFGAATITAYCTLYPGVARVSLYIFSVINLPVNHLVCNLF
jgi:dienelactone hydrolase